MLKISKYPIFIFSVVSLFVILGSCNSKPEAPDRPNIIFIMSDDHAYQAISAYSDRLITTPNIDRIAEEGMLFSNACVTNSICAPSRATILTGKHTHINGKIDNNFPFDTTNVTFPQLLHNAVIRLPCLGNCILETIRRVSMNSKFFPDRAIITILNLSRIKVIPLFRVMLPILSPILLSTGSTTEEMMISPFF